MLLTITTTQPPATDLGYLLHKHPGKVQSFPLAFGAAHVFYPEATEKRCTAALLLDIDPIGLVRGRRSLCAPCKLAEIATVLWSSSFVGLRLAGAGCACG